MIYTLTINVSREADSPQGAYAVIAESMRQGILSGAFDAWESDRLEDEAGQEFPANDYLP